MANDWDALAEYVGTDSHDFVRQCWDEAEAMVSAYVGDHDVPEVSLNRAILEVGSELFHRKQAPNGVANFMTFDGSAPIRVARDPMIGAYPILKRHIAGVGIL